MHSLCTNCHLKAHGSNPWDKGGKNMRKALVILALFAVTSGCAASKVMDCATSTAYATLQCGGAMLTGGDGACAHACADAALFCGEAAAEEFDEKTDSNPAKEPRQKQREKPREGHREDGNR